MAGHFVLEYGNGHGKVYYAQWADDGLTTRYGWRLEGWTPRLSTFRSCRDFEKGQGFSGLKLTVGQMGMAHKYLCPYEFLDGVIE